MTDEELKAHAATIEKYLIDNGVEGSYVTKDWGLSRLGNKILITGQFGVLCEIQQANELVLAKVINHVNDWVKRSRKKREEAVRASQEARSRIRKFARSLSD